MRRLTDRLSEARRDQRGFTLIELLIVIVILGILAAIVVFSVRGITDKGDLSACKAEVATVATAEEASYAQDNKYRSLADLHNDNFLRGGTPNEKYVASIDTTTGSMTLKAGVPSGCTAA